MPVFILPGPICATRQCPPNPFLSPFDQANSAVAFSPQPLGMLGTGVEIPSGFSRTPILGTEYLGEDHQMLAALAYAEASVANIFEEMAAIANTVVNRMRGQGHTSVVDFFNDRKQEGYAAGIGNVRYNRYMLLSQGPGVPRISGFPQMENAFEAAENALSMNPIDYSNGAYFWEGKDFSHNVKNNRPGTRYLDGVRFSLPEHNLENIPEAKILSARMKKNRKGDYDYTYETTAAYGGTIFMRYTLEWKRATSGVDWL